jgi:hypothetical protein
MREEGRLAAGPPCLTLRDPLRDRARVPEDEQAEVPVACEDDAAAARILSQRHTPEVVAGRVDVVTDPARNGSIDVAGRARDVERRSADEGLAATIVFSVPPGG